MLVSVSSEGYRSGMFYCQSCRMQVSDMMSHREQYHPEPPYDDGNRYTLREAARELARQECRFRGHVWDLVENFGSAVPLAILCTRCGVTHKVLVEETVTA